MQKTLFCDTTYETQLDTNKCRLVVLKRNHLIQKDLEAFVQMFFEIGVPKKIHKFRRKTTVLESPFNNVAGVALKLH